MFGEKIIFGQKRQKLLEELAGINMCKRIISSAEPNLGAMNESLNLYAIQMQN